METKLFVAAKAFITYQGKTLLVRESNKYADGTQQGLYGEVGGRVQPGEAFFDSLKREILEETGLTVAVGKVFHVMEWWPKVRGEQWQIIGIFFECVAESYQVTLSEDHDDFIWIDPKDYANFPIMPDLPPVFEAYLKIKN